MKTQKPRRVLPLILCLVCFVSGYVRGQAQENAASSSRSQVNPLAYDPLNIDDNSKVETLLFEFEYQPQLKTLRKTNASEEMRKIPVKAYFSDGAASPVVLFSHGLGGSREGFKHGGEHWAKRGYIAFFIQHPGAMKAFGAKEGLGNAWVPCEKPPTLKTCSYGSKM